MKLSTIPHLVASSLLLVQAADAAGIGSQRQSPSTRFTSDTSTQSNARLFPLLTKLRDSTIEFIFGRHPTKEAIQPQVPKDLRVQYTDELVLRFNVSTTDEETALADAAARLFLDVWSFTSDYVDIRLHADEVGPLLGLLPKSLRSSQSTLIPDLAAAVYQSLPEYGTPHHAQPHSGSNLLVNTPTAGDNVFFQDYQPLPVIVRWMRLLEAMFPSYVEFITVGKSYEGRDIPGLRVGVPDLDDPAPPRKTIVVMGGSHAREWISTSTVTYLAWSFITAYGKERTITKLLEKFDIIFLPVANPDGFDYTWHVDRLWRKTRQETNLRYCRGLDLDRSFGFEWNYSQTHRDPCSESYGGEEPFQAVEAIEISNWAKNQTLNNVRFVGLLDLHSYSQQILFPYSYSCAVEPPNLENLEELAVNIAKAIRLSNGEPYTVTSACEGAVSAQESNRQRFWPRIESGGGSAIDWFYHELRAHYSYQIKLRDTGSYGFLLPKEQILPTGEEMFNAMKYYGDYLLGNNGIESFPDESPGLMPPLPDTPSDEDMELPFSQDLRRRKLRK